MSDRASRPYGHHSVEIQALFAPDSPGGNGHGAALPPRHGFGWHTLRVNAAIVPEGQEAHAPGYPFVRLGQAMFPSNDRQDQAAGMAVSAEGVPPDKVRGRDRSPPPLAGGEWGEGSYRRHLPGLPPPPGPFPQGEGEHSFGPAADAYGTGRGHGGSRDTETAPKAGRSHPGGPPSPAVKPNALSAKALKRLLLATWKRKRLSP
jgi:hypothetical protein